MTQRGPDEHPIVLDEDSFREFYDRALPAVYGYLSKRCGGRRDIVEDLTQETFVAAVKAMQAGEPIGAPMAWIVTIARRRLVDHWRRQSASLRRLAILEATSGSRSLDPPEPASPIIAALESLTPPHRAVLVLRYVDDLSVRDVGKLLGRSERATESLLVRARTALSAAYRGAAGG
jgi:RNA polymerase sigma-70 factor (ECF subfamily)